MKKFKFENKEYNILEEKCEIENDWELKISDQFKIKDIFAFRPWWIGNKFRWFKKIKVKYQLQFIRYSKFDDGWNYMNYWGPWHIIWDAVEIL